MSKSLIIVESPAKVKTIKKFLGDNYMVQASVGHIRDLPVNELGVDEERDFAPKYRVIEGKEKVVSGLRSAAAKADVVYLAPDPDREGEAIAWHVAELIRDKVPVIKRIRFNEITAKAVREALECPRELDERLFDAQQARRVLDRLVGYKISPLLWKSVKRGISAGRVQSVALRIIVEREEERRAFVSEEYWLFRALLAAGTPPAFRADLYKVEGRKPRIPDADAADALEAALRGKPFVVSGLQEKERAKAPAPPYITSSLQQAANRRLGYTAKRTMSIAQRLYEGVDLGESGVMALITYMRTDSFRIADEARRAAREFIETAWGREYLPDKPRIYKSRGGAQDAHEAVRPVDVNITPEEVKDRLAPEQYQLYRLIWSRFVASQAASARFRDTTVTIDCGPAQWRARGECMLFPGWLAAYPQIRRKEGAGTDAEEGEEQEIVELPELRKGQLLRLEKLSKEQKFTQPPPRYSEASLVRELEERGIGRPSTYAGIISTLQDREYARMEDKHLVPTDLGCVVCDQLRGHFADLMDIGFTAEMETRLDRIAEGGLSRVELLGDFARAFNPVLENAARNMTTVKGGIPAGIACPECGKPAVIKFGKAGAFLACTGYPDCRFTANFSRDEKGKLHPEARTRPEAEKVGVCPECGGDLVVKKARTGSRFIACANYPRCAHAAPFGTGVPCPREGCGGELVEKSSRKGKIFYSCNRYPSCDFALWDPPVAGSCPLCGSPVLVEKTTRAGGRRVACPRKGCRFARREEDAREEDARETP
jgi:DNA topoisomerase-1